MAPSVRDRACKNKARTPTGAGLSNLLLLEQQGNQASDHLLIVLVTAVYP
jgi:hypothetical protein